MPDRDPIHCLVTRASSAVPRRAGRAWPSGETAADLTEDQMRALEKTPGYAVERLELTGSEEPALFPTPAPKRARRG